MEEQKALIFKRFEVSKILFERSEDFNSSGRYNIDIKYKTQVNTGNENLFQAVFIVEISEVSPQFSAQIEVIGLFEQTGNPDPSTRNTFLNISAPAIVFPYLRSFISNLFLQAGLKPLILPTLNFASKTSKELDIPPRAKALSRSKPLVKAIKKSS